MRWKRSFIIASLLSLLLASASYAAPPGDGQTSTYDLEYDVPGSYENVNEKGLPEVQKYMDQAQCGGMVPISDTGGTDKKKKDQGDTSVYPQIANMPGRTNVPLASIADGMGFRSQFKFPPNPSGIVSAGVQPNGDYGDDTVKNNTAKVWGFVTACDVFSLKFNQAGLCLKGSTKANPSDCYQLYKQLRDMGKAVAKPGDPDKTCLEKITPDKGSWAALDGTGRGYRMDQNLHCYDPQFTYECIGDGDMRTNPKLPLGCQTPEPPQFTFTPPVCEGGVKPDYLCPEVPGPNPKDPRCKPGDVGFFQDNAGVIKKVNVKRATLAWYPSSFFRYFGGEISAPAAKTSWKLDAMCYEQYQENDPKTKLTTAKDEQCEFYMPDAKKVPTNLFVIGGTDAPQWPDLWKKMESKITPEWPDKAAGKQKIDAPKNPDMTNTVDPRTLDGAWNPDARGSMSMPVTEAVTTLYGAATGDIRGSLPQSVEVKERAAAALAVHVGPFDDTAFLMKSGSPSPAGGVYKVPEQSLSSWIEAQERQIVKALDPGIVRLILPAAFFEGLSPTDPVLAALKNLPSTPDGRNGTIVRTGEQSVLQPVIASFRRFFAMPVEEVRIPLPVILLSRQEAESRITEWKRFLAQGGTSGDQYIKRIQEYLDAAEKARALREEVPKQLQNVYDAQKLMRGFFASWEQQNTDKMTQWKKQATSVAVLQQYYRWFKGFTLLITACNLDWCSNQRFSAPIYSLLDGWSSRSPFALKPSITPVPADVAKLHDLRELGLQPAEDQSYDFSWISFARAPRAPLVIPVLDIRPISVNLPLAPTSIKGQLPDIEQFQKPPELPDSLFSFIPKPVVCFPEKITLKGGKTAQVKGAKGNCYDTMPKVDGQKLADLFSIDARYLLPAPKPSAAENVGKVTRFIQTWFTGECKKLKDGTNSCDFTTQDTGKTGAKLQLYPAQLNRDGAAGAFCRFTYSLFPPVTDRAARLVQVPYDLKERAARLFARWMPNTATDVKGNQDRIARDSKLQAEQDKKSGVKAADKPKQCTDLLTCVQLGKEKLFSLRWQWIAPDMSELLRKTSAYLADLLIYEPKDTPPYRQTYKKDLLRFWPSDTVPLTIDLTNTASSSSSAK